MLSEHKRNRLQYIFAHIIPDPWISNEKWTTQQCVVFIVMVWFNEPYPFVYIRNKQDEQRIEIVKWVNAELKAHLQHFFLHLNLHILLICLRGDNISSH